MGQDITYPFTYLGQYLNNQSPKQKAAHLREIKSQNKSTNGHEASRETGYMPRAHLLCTPVQKPRSSLRSYLTELVPCYFYLCYFDQETTEANWERREMAERKEETSEWDSMSPVALQAPITIVRPVRDDLQRHLPKPCKFFFLIFYF